MCTFREVSTREVNVEEFHLSWQSLGRPCSQRKCRPCRYQRIYLRHRNRSLRGCDSGGQGYRYSDVDQCAGNHSHGCEKGFYAFPALSVDQYRITLAQPGFDQFLMSGIVINANSAVRVDIKLTIGKVANTIEVKSDALQVETQSTQMGEVIEGEKISSMPLNGRSFIYLLALQPGVSPYQGNDDTSGVGASTISGDQQNGTQSVNGGRVGSNGFMVNGADAEEGVHNGAAMIPNLDSIAEFRIITNNFNAEYGNFSGGQINVVTKSGTNKFSGNLFEFLRNTDLDAKNYFSSDRGVFIQNQFGGTVGGPIKKDKVFFFADYQGTRQIVGAAQNFPVPSAADRTGDLSDQASALEGSDPASGGQGVAGTYWTWRSMPESLLSCD